MNLLGKILATALLALEDAGQGYSNPVQIWLQKQATAEKTAT